jgi:hypothetical protein
VNSRKERAAVVGVGVAGCAACCAGPVLGYLAALGAGTLLAVSVLGVLGLVAAGVGVTWFLRSRRRRAACSPGPFEVDVPAPTMRAGREAAPHAAAGQRERD